MVLNTLIRIILILGSAFYVVLQILKNEFAALGIIAGVMLLLAYYYSRTVVHKEPLFLSFLIISGIARLIEHLSWYFPIDHGFNEYSYYLGSVLLISSYTLLILLLCKTMNFKRIISQFYITIGVLVVLNIFSVTLISDTTASVLGFGENIVEFIYTSVVMILLSIALVNYMDKTDNKSMLFLVGSICIFFSETIQLAYLYIIDTTALAAFYSITLVLAFTLYYLQSRLEYSKPVDYFSKDNLKA